MLTDERFLAVVCSNVRVQQGFLRCPVLTPLNGALVYLPLVRAFMRSKVRIVLGAERTLFTLKLLLIRVYCLNNVYLLILHSFS